MDIGTLTPHKTVLLILKYSSAFQAFPDILALLAT